MTKLDIMSIPRGGRNPRATLELNLLEKLVKNAGPNGITKDDLLQTWRASLPLIQQLTKPSAKEVKYGPNYDGEPSSWFGQRMGTLITNERAAAARVDGVWRYFDPLKFPSN